MVYTAKTRVPDELLAATYKKHGRIKETAQELNLDPKTTTERAGSCRRQPHFLNFQH